MNAEGHTGPVKGRKAQAWSKQVTTTQPHAVAVNIGMNVELDLPVFQEKWKSGILKCNLPNFINVSN